MKSREMNNYFGHTIILSNCKLLFESAFGAQAHTGVTSSEDKNALAEQYATPFKGKNMPVPIGAIAQHEEYSVDYIMNAKNS